MRFLTTWPLDSWKRPAVSARVIVATFFVFSLMPLLGSAEAQWWPEALNKALDQAGTNRSQLFQALQNVPESQRNSMQFLVENMPQCDLESLSAEFLLENVRVAFQTFEAAPWAKNVPADIFLNDVLPYCSLNEQRDNWRKRLLEICAPLAEGARTPGEAAQALNQRLFPLLKVRYSTKRRRPDQGPFETMESGMATCTGLSILLVDACRAVGVPARIAGTPLWADNRGNHTWVEVWDGGWHFAGAAEPDPAGLDRGWFVGSAAQAIKDEPEHAIYASSFRKTGLSFPLSWARSLDYVSAINVTERYTGGAKPEEESKLKLRVNVLERPAGDRIASKVVITDAADPKLNFSGMSKQDPADVNDHLTFRVPKEHTYLVETGADGHMQVQYFTAGTNSQDMLVVYLSGVPKAVVPAAFCCRAPGAVKPLAKNDEAKLRAGLTDYFLAATNLQASWKFSSGLEKLLARNEPAVRRVTWDVFRSLPIHGVLKQDFDAKQVRFEKYLSPYTLKPIGQKPADGWPLFIAMHGGGGTPQRVNDQQWQVMQRYYREHPELGGYLYVALRAPNNEWNGFYTDYIYPLVSNLIRQFLLFAEVDPDKVFLMGYSHGGYGAFAIGPKMPDRFAAIHASAAAPADGGVADTLRNTVFTFMVGEKDTMYGRLNLCQGFDVAVQKLRGSSSDIYPVTFQYVTGNGHAGLPDRDKITEMYPAVRNPAPRELRWAMTDAVIRDFYWIHSGSPAAGKTIAATSRNNRVAVTINDGPLSGSIFLDSRLVDFTKPVVFDINGKVSKHKLRPSLRTLCETTQRRGDSQLAFTAQFDWP